MRSNFDKNLGKFKRLSSTMAQSFNEWRVGDKIMGALWTLIAYKAWQWFDNHDTITAEQAAFLGAIIAASVGYCKLYLESHSKGGS